MLMHDRTNHCKISFSLLTLALGLASCSHQAAPTVSLKGAGASFPAPLYEMWFERYQQENSNVEITYDAVGSGMGIQQFLAHEVDFASTDVPLTHAEIAQFPSMQGNLLQLPIAGSAIVLAYNLSGVEQLKLSRAAYCDIVSGDITQWNDPILAADNPNIDLPHVPITFVHRADSSGTTFIFANHLAQACPNWTIEASKTVDWAVGEAASGNIGVTAKIKQTEGAIGYIGFAYAEQGFLSMATLENKAGFFIEPSPNSAETATEDLSFSNNLVASFPDPTETDAYPIIGLTYLLLYEKYPDSAKQVALKDLIQWALFEEGQAIANSMGYSSLSTGLANGSMPSF